MFEWISPEKLCIEASPQSPFALYHSILSTFYSTSVSFESRVWLFLCGDSSAYPGKELIHTAAVSLAKAYVVKERENSFLFSTGANIYIQSLSVDVGEITKPQI